MLISKSPLDSPQEGRLSSVKQSKGNLILADMDSGNILLFALCLLSPTLRNFQHS